MKPQVIGLVLAMACSPWACLSPGSPSLPAGTLTLDVAPLSLPGVTNVTYTLRVARGLPEPTTGPDSDLPASTVWSRTLASTQFGTPGGALTFVGACDASDQDLATPSIESPNSVYLTIDVIEAPTPLVSGVDFINPCPASAPCIRTTDCLENQDSLLSYNLTVMRKANQGFFDVAVSFSDIFCSGKVDCNPALLHDSSGARARTTVAAFACTAGADLDSDPTNDTHLFANDLVVHCLNGSAPDAISVLDLAAAGGRHDASPFGTAPEAVDTFALYGGIESVQGYKKGYWNLALTLAPNQSECTLTGAATAAAGNWPTGHSPANTIYPVILFDDIDLGASNDTCHDAHPLDGPGSDVHTAYTSSTSRCFGNVGVILPTTLDRSDTTCGLVDPCDSNNGGCHALTTCYDTGGQAYCGPCPAGYTGTGATGCTDINECDSNNGGCDALTTCTNTPGSYTCGPCPTGYSGTGATACTDINECATNNGGCDTLTTCTNTTGSRTCGSCPAGYSGTGATGCTDIDECATNNGGCDTLTACTNTTGSRTCGPCPAGYSGTGATGCVPSSSSLQYLAFQQDNLEVSVGKTGRLNVLAYDGTELVDFGAPSRYATLASSDPTCVTVPSSVYLYSPYSSANVTVTAKSIVGCTATITVTDSLLGTDTAVVTTLPLPDLGALYFTSNDEYKVGDSLETYLTVGLPNDRPSHDPIQVTLTSSDPSRALLSTSTSAAGAATVTVTLSNISDSQNFYVRARPGTAGASVSIIASQARCDTGIADVSIVPHAIRLDETYATRTVSTTQVNSDDGFRLLVGVLLNNGTLRAQRVSRDLTGLPVTVTVTPPVANNTSLLISNGASAALSQIVSIAPGEYYFNYSSSTSVLALRLKTNPTAGTYTVSASSDGSDLTFAERTQTVVVSVATSTITFTESGSFDKRIGSGLQSHFTVALTSGHPALTVNLESSAPDRVFLSRSATTPGSTTLAVSLTNTQNSFTIYIQTVSSAATGPVTVRATASGYVDGELALNIVNPLVEIIGEDYQTVTGTQYTDTPEDGLYFRVGIPNLTNASSLIYQDVSGAAAPMIVTLTKTASSSATLKTLDDTGDAVTTTIAANTYQTPTSYASGGIVVDYAYPATLGTSSFTCTASVPNSAPHTLSTFSVSRTINAAQMTWTSAYNTDRIGGGSAATYQVTLSASDHKGVTIRFSSSDPSIARVATSTSATSSSDYLDFVMNDGATVKNVALHGVSGATGTVTLTAECITPGCYFGTISRTVDVVPIVPVIQSVSDTLTTNTINSATENLGGYVYLYIRNASNNLQGVTVAGSMAPFSVTLDVTSNLSSHVFLNQGANNGQVILVSVASGNSNSSQFFFKVAGNASAGVYPSVIRAVAPGVGAEVTDTHTVTVTSQQVYVKLTHAYTNLAAGLVERMTASLQTSSGAAITNHDGVTVRLTHDTGGYLSSSYGGAPSQILDLVFTANDDAVFFYTQGSGAESTVTGTLENAVDGSLPFTATPPLVQFSRSGYGDIGTTLSWGPATYSVALGARLNAKTPARAAYAPFGGYLVNYAISSGNCSLSQSSLTVEAGTYATSTYPVTVSRSPGVTGTCVVTAAPANDPTAARTLTITMN